MILVFKEFLQTSIPPLTSLLHAKGYQDFPLKKFESYSAEKFRRGAHLCSRKILVSKKVTDKRGGGYHDFPSKLFCPTVLNHFVEEPLCVSEIFSYQKILCLRGEYHDFLQKNCCLTVPNNFVGEPCSVSLISGNEKNYCFRSLCHDFLSKLFCLAVPKNFVGEPFCAVFYKKFLMSKNFMDKRGVGEYVHFPSKIFVSQCRKTSGDLSVFQKNFGIA